MLVWGIFMVLVEMWEQDEEGTSEEEPVGMEEGVSLGMALMGTALITEMKNKFSPKLPGNKGPKGEFHHLKMETRAHLGGRCVSDTKF